MKIKIVFLLIAISSGLSGYTQIPVIGTIIGKVIKAVDLKVQKMQNEAIWLQYAQQVLQKKLSETNLAEIKDITQDQKQLYSDYYKEFLQVKKVISSSELLTIVGTHIDQFIKEYRQTWKLLQQYSLFSASEMDDLQTVYGGMVTKVAACQKQLRPAINPYESSMIDEERLEVIRTCEENAGRYLDDLRQFNRENMEALMRRAKEKHDMVVIKRLNGIQ